ncbi:hypothetical protein HNR46_002483 [Haloferula luteola]|uniref:Uncharacterized protein n=1 Tax=Haloferula luteola TaxID=595692 RepID=A0A840VEF2_9BACT|nr:hypothetical protein [Haloferula luteola]
MSALLGRGGERSRIGLGADMSAPGEVWGRFVRSRESGVMPPQSEEGGKECADMSALFGRGGERSRIGLGADMSAPGEVWRRFARGCESGVMPPQSEEGVEECADMSALLGRGGERSRIGLGADMSALGEVWGRCVRGCESGVVPPQSEEGRHVLSSSSTRADLSSTDSPKSPKENVVNRREIFEGRACLGSIRCRSGRSKS